MDFHNINDFPFGDCGKTNPKPNFTKRTLEPMVTGASVIGIKFNEGVAVASDMTGSFGRLVEFKDLNRIVEINKKILLTASGDCADFQYLTEHLKRKAIYEEVCNEDDFLLKPKSLHQYLSLMLYYRRCEMNPLWLACLIGGINDDGSPYLGFTDMLGTAYEDDCIATGVARYLAAPMMRDALEKNKKMSLKEAEEVVDKCMTVLFYRDCESYEKYQIATVTKKGVTISEPKVVNSNWDIAEYDSGF